MTRLAAPTPPAIAEAARLLKAGGIVAFPTETVYGLGAIATDEASVRRVFAVKGRPADNPVIVHVATLGEIVHIARGFDERAARLASEFWPGPLTLVLPRHENVPDAVTAGLSTVAVRMPAHPVALALLQQTGPLAAPSANRSGRPSPTRAQHVLDDLGDAVDLVLDGGPCAIGVESTVLDLSVTTPMVLRPGGITVERLIACIGPVHLHPTVDDPRRQTDARAPGMKHRHYSPRAELVLVEGEHTAAVRRALALAHEVGSGAVLGVEIDLQGAPGRSFRTVAEATQGLFETLRELDRRHHPRIVVVGVAVDGLGRTLMNRLRKAAARIEYVGSDQ